jgi:hypothetical protein
VLHWFPRSLLEATIRRFTSVLLLLAGITLAVLAAITWYVRDVFYDEAKFVEVTTEALASPAVRDRIATEFTDELLDLGNLPSGIDDDGTTTVLRQQQEELVREQVDVVLDSPIVAPMIDQTLRELHAELLLAAENESDLISESDGQVVIDLERLFAAVASGLGGDSVTEDLAAVEIPEGSGQYVVVDQNSAVGLVWDILAASDGVAALMFAAAVAALVASVLISDRRPWSVTAAGFGVFATAALIVIAVFVFRGLMAILIPDKGSADTVAGVYDKLIFPLVRLELALVGIGLAVVVAGLILRYFFPDQDEVYEYGAYDPYGQQAAWYQPPPATPAWHDPNLGR